MSPVGLLLTLLMAPARGATAPAETPAQEAALDPAPPVCLGLLCPRAERAALWGWSVTPFFGVPEGVGVEALGRLLLAGRRDLQGSRHQALFLAVEPGLFGGHAAGGWEGVLRGSRGGVGGRIGVQGYLGWMGEADRLYGHAFLGPRVDLLAGWVTIRGGVAWNLDPAGPPVTLDGAVGVGF